MLFIKCYTVCGIVTPVSLATNFAADGHLGGKAHDSNTYFVVDERSYRLVYITGIGGKEGTKYDENLTGAMAWGMAVAR